MMEREIEHMRQGETVNNGMQSTEGLNKRQRRYKTQNKKHNNYSLYGSFTRSILWKYATAVF